MPVPTNPVAWGRLDGRLSDPSMSRSVIGSRSLTVTALSGLLATIIGEGTFRDMLLSVLVAFGASFSVGSSPTTYSLTTVLLRTPTLSISTVTTSPGIIPVVFPGVPVKMRSPGSSVM